MAQAPIIACLVVLVFRRDLTTVAVTSENGQEYSHALGASLFLTSLSAIWFGCSNSVREIIGEWAIYRRERMVNLKIGPYVAAKFTVLSLLCLIQCSVMLGIVHGGLHLQGPWWLMFGLMLIASLVGVGFGLAISAISRTTEMAIALVPIVLLFMVIFGGVLPPIYKLPEAIQPIYWVIPSRWAFEGMLVLESDSRKPYTPRVQEDTPPVLALPRDLAEFHFPKQKLNEANNTLEDYRYGPVIGGMVLETLFIVLVAAVAGILRMRDLH